MITPRNLDVKVNEKVANIAMIESAGESVMLLNTLQSTDLQLVRIIAQLYNAIEHQVNYLYSKRYEKLPTSTHQSAQELGVNSKCFHRLRFARNILIHCVSQEDIISYFAERKNELQKLSHSIKQIVWTLEILLCEEDEKARLRKMKEKERHKNLCKLRKPSWMLKAS